ncbi:endonuclease V [Antribacter gilvus]|uniref:endonuclease V n=1 Tax=Antribacter gilvus TaxID=2304675 RepID=UPI001F0C2819|nr:endonuclease V [Antribacter gilvus]
MGRFGAVDVQYPADGGARAAVVVAPTAEFGELIEERTHWLDDVAEYRPGAFYERELPSLRALLAEVDPLDLLIVDGYVDLDPAGRAGLGAHVHTAGLAPVVIGVAKTAFYAATHAVPVTRGRSVRPLWVTAAGLSVVEAAELVRNMAGDARLPDALRRVDRLARGAT